MKTLLTHSNGIFKDARYVTLVNQYNKMKTKITSLWNLIGIKKSKHLFEWFVADVFDDDCLILVFHQLMLSKHGGKDFTSSDQNWFVNLKGFAFLSWNTSIIFLWNLPFPSLLQFIMLFYYFKTRSPFQVLLSNKIFWSCAKNLKSGFGKSNHFLCLSDSKWATITLKFNVAVGLYKCVRWHIFTVLSNTLFQMYKVNLNFSELLDIL